MSRRIVHDEPARVPKKDKSGIAKAQAAAARHCTDVVELLKGIIPKTSPASRLFAQDGPMLALSDLTKVLVMSNNTSRMAQRRTWQRRTPLMAANRPGQSGLGRRGARQGIGIPRGSHVGSIIVNFVPGREGQAIPHDGRALLDEGCARGG